jgi:hypothetical protein
MWDFFAESRLMDWGLVDRHRQRAYREGLRDGALLGCLLVVAFGGALALWLR